MKNDFEYTLISKEQIDKRVQEIADQISLDYINKKPLLIGILKGSVIFVADLIRKISIPCHIEFMAVSSYGSSTKSSGEVRIIKDLNVPINGKDVIIVEDIVDSGNTLSFLKRNLLSRNPNSIRICSLLDKPDRRKTQIEVDYCGFTIPDEFAVGYGLDYNEDYRQCDEIYVLKREIYEK